MGKKKRGGKAGGAAHGEDDGEHDEEEETSHTMGGGMKSGPAGELPDDLIAEIEQNSEVAKTKGLTDAMGDVGLGKDYEVEERVAPPDSPDIMAAISEADSLFKRNASPAAERSPVLTATAPADTRKPLAQVSHSGSGTALAAGAGAGGAGGSKAAHRDSERKLSDRDHHAKVWSSSVVDMALCDGLALLWDGKFEEADKLLAAPADRRPRHALLYGEIPLIRFMSTADMADMAKARTRLDAAKVLTEKCVQNQHYMVEVMRESVSTLINHEMVEEWSLDCQLVLADINMLRGFVLLTSGILDKGMGLLSLRSSWKEYQALEAKLSTCGEVATSSLLFGLGFFQLMIGLTPGELHFILEAVGFVADAMAGIKYLTKCYWDGGFRAPMAGKVLVACYYLFPGGKQTETYKYLKQEAEKVAEDLIPKYPHAPGVLTIASFYKSMKGDFPASHEHISQAVTIMRGTGIHAVYVEATMCFSLHRLRRWDDCQKECHAFFKKTSLDNSFFQERSLVLYLALNAFKMLNNEEKIKALSDFLVKYVDCLASPSRQDHYVKYMVSKPTKTSGVVAALEIMYLQNEIHSLTNEDAEWWYKSLMSLDEVAKKNAGPPGEHCRMLLVKGALLFQLGKTMEAMECFADSDALTWAKLPKEDQYLMVCVAIEVAGVFLMHDKLEDAGGMIKKASSLSSYMMDARIKPRVKVLGAELRNRRQMRSSDAAATDAAMGGPGGSGSTGNVTQQTGAFMNAVQGKISSWFGSKPAEAKTAAQVAAKYQKN